jgi:hypothetical protein
MLLLQNGRKANAAPNPRNLGSRSNCRDIGVDSHAKARERNEFNCFMPFLPDRVRRRLF